MLRNYFIVALRNLLRNKTSSFIQIASLSVGMVCFAIISLYVYRELSFDQFHDHPEQVYRVVKDFVNDDGTTIPDATTPPALAPALWKDLPEINSATRVFPNWGRKYLLQVGESRHYEERLLRIDSSFFDVFTFPFVAGDKKTALLNPNFILLTESSARRYFGDQDPLGKPVKIDIGENGTDFFVSGVLKDVPENAHFTFDFLISIRSFNFAETDITWGWYNFYTYVRLKPETDPEDFKSKLQPIFNKYRPENKNRFYAQALTDIHLRSNLKWELGANGDALYIRVLSTIAIFVLLLAVINYINLVTAQSTRRAKEVGVRKVSGAFHGLLIRQFLLESMILALSATFLSIAIAEAILPLFSDLFNGSMSFLDEQGLPVLAGLVLAGILTGLLAGLYPAFYLSSFKPVNVLKGALVQTTAGTFLRKGLVTFQFVISTALIAGALVISKQINFILNKNLGFEKENVVMINNAGNLKNLDAVLLEIAKVDGVLKAGGADGVIGGQNWTDGARAKGQPTDLLLNFLCVDYNFLDVMGVSFQEGRNFAPQFGTDSTGIIINETAARQLGLQEPYINGQVSLDEDSLGNPIYYNVVGVTRDFHFTSFHDPIKPFGFVLYKPRVATLFVKVSGQDLSKTIEGIRQTWSNWLPDRPFEFRFQDEQMAKLYSNEQRFQTLFSYFTLVAIVIASLGLFGLSAFTIQQRTKEIGIRKVLGASATGITQMLSRDFMKLVLVGIVLAIPLGWYSGNQWLNGFAYKTEISWWLFAAAGGIAVLIALLTVGFQSIRAALTNPVNSLRNE